MLFINLKIYKKINLQETRPHSLPCHHLSNILANKYFTTILSFCFNFKYMLARNHRFLKNDWGGVS